MTTTLTKRQRDYAAHFPHGTVEVFTPSNYSQVKVVWKACHKLGFRGSYSGPYLCVWPESLKNGDLLNSACRWAVSSENSFSPTRREDAAHKARVLINWVDGAQVALDRFRNPLTV